MNAVAQTMLALQRALNGTLMVVAKICLVFLTVSVIYGVALRATTGSAPNWVFESSTLLMMPLTYLVAGPIAQNKGHIAIGLVTDVLPNRVSRIVERVGEAVLAVFMAYLTVQAFDRFQDILASGLVTGSAKIPHWPLAVTVPIGLAAMTTQVILHLAVNVTTRTEGVNK